MKRHYPNDPFEKHEDEAKRNVARENSWSYKGVHNNPNAVGMPALMFMRTVTKMEVRKEKKKRIVTRKGLENTYIIFVSNTASWGAVEHHRWDVSLTEWRKRNPDVDNDHCIDLTRKTQHSVVGYLNVQKPLMDAGLLSHLHGKNEPMEELKGKRILLVWLAENGSHYGAYTNGCSISDFISGEVMHNLASEYMSHIRNVFRHAERFQQVVMMENCFAGYWTGKIFTNDFPVLLDVFYGLHRNAPAHMQVISDDDWRGLKRRMLVDEVKNDVYQQLKDDGGLHRYGLSVETPANKEQPLGSFDAKELDTWIGEWPTYTVEEEYEEDVWHSWEEIEYHWVPGVEWSTPVDGKYAWTMSYSLATKSWVSWHSYTPYCYIRHGNSFLSAELIKPNKLYSHSEWNNGKSHPVYQRYYERDYPMIVEVVGRAKNDEIKTWEDFAWRTTAVWYDSGGEDPISTHDATFTQVMLYNEEQNTGWLGMQRKDEDTDYMMQAVREPDPSRILMSRKENVWRVHTIRDARLNVPEKSTHWNRMFRTRINDVMGQYGHWIDKVLNDDAVNAQRMDWQDRQPLRDSYICCRLVYDGDQASLINLTLHLHGFSELNSDR